MPPKILFGCASIGGKFTTTSAVSELLATLTTQGITQLDTAARYGASGSGGGAVGASEILLGEADAAAHGFTLDSKILYLGDGTPELSAAKIEASTVRSLQRLKVPKLHTLYFHAPDAVTPLEEQARGMDGQYRAGRMEKVGISNFSPEMVAEYVEVCKAGGYVLPAVYQGQYNLLSRQYETSLFPLLRREGMAFVAYSPLANGFLTAGEGKPATAMQEKVYGAAKIRNAVAKFRERVEGAGMSATEAALRWTVYHSALGDGDALILGASRKEQVVDSIEIVKKGPLGETVVQAVEQVWEDVREI